MNEKKNIQLKTKDDLVNRLRNIIRHLSNFISISETMIHSSEKVINIEVFKEMIEEIRGIPEDLKESPVLIEDTIKFVDGIVGEVHDIRMQIETGFSLDSSLKDAVNTLDKIPTSTFRATDQILNILDELMARDGELLQIMEEVCVNKDSKSEEILKTYRSILEKNQNAHFAIMDALQFQDITTQQIEHVNDLLEKTEIKLSELSLKLRGLDEVDIKRIIDKYEKRKRIYDPSAEYKHKSDEQDFADKIYEENNLKQDDIEDLISQFRDDNETS